MELCSLTLGRARMCYGPYSIYSRVVLATCLLTDLNTLLSYSDVQSSNLQLHDEPITHQKSDEGNLKVKNPRAKNR